METPVIMRTILRFLIGAAAMLLFSMPVHAQTTLTHTTLSGAITASATSFAVASATNIAADVRLFVDKELMIVTAVSGTTVTVRRAVANGGQATRHASGARVWVDNATQGSPFITYDVSGACLTSEMRWTPMINTANGSIFECEGGYWLKWLSESTAEPHYREYTVRDGFDGATNAMEDDGTAKTVTDAGINIIFGSPLGTLSMREELTKTASSWVVINGVLDISADDTTNDEGVEIVVGNGTAPTGHQFFEAQTQAACIAVSVDVADISGTDQVQIGFRQNEAYQDNAAYAGYTVWNTVGINASDGSIVSSQEVSEATDTDDSGVDFADGDTRALKVCVDHDGVPTAFYSDAYTTSQTLQDVPAWNAITMTNTGSAITSGLGMVPFISYMAAGTDGAGVTINWVELTRLP